MRSCFSFLWFLQLNTGFVELAWDSHQDFKNFVANETGEHTKLRELLAPTRGSPGLSGINKVMVTFTSDPTPALRAPVTEIALATLKPGADSQSISESVGKIVPTTNGSGPSALGAALGFVIDEPERLALVTGWNSIEVCLATRRQTMSSLTQSGPFMLGPQAGSRKWRGIHHAGGIQSDHYGTTLLPLYPCQPLVWSDALGGQSRLTGRSIGHMCSQKF
jgi:hypothetical protein